MKTVNIIFPNQLFNQGPLLENKHEIYLIEEHLFFTQYKFHKQKIAFHRASLKAFENYLLSLNKKVHYIEAHDPLGDIRAFEQEIKAKNIEALCLYTPTDDWLNQRVAALSIAESITFHPTPQFINTEEELTPFFRSDKKSFFQTTFYKQQRKKLGILIDAEQNPTGGKWTYDTENRKKYPKNKLPPAINFPQQRKEWEEACSYTHDKFQDNPGNLSRDRIYPITHKEANAWFEEFLNYRFFEFGAYEDAILKEHTFLHHSILSPLLNSGLLLPMQIVNSAISFSKKENIPINSTEGFIRQIIGWREFIRGMYLYKGRFSRSKNFWNFNRKIPSSFYTATTGIEPIDDTIKKVLQTGYCHHIERLMLLGNFMLLCEFNADDVYRWFMELFIDAYDWVMVPNVYGMCLFADGGTFATKPYIGGSNYIKKMSNYPKGEWEKIWDGMFWRFVEKHQEFFLSNPRTSMLVHSLNRMSDEKKQLHHEHANSFINKTLGKG